MIMNEDALHINSGMIAICDQNRCEQHRRT